MNFNYFCISSTRKQSQRTSISIDCSATLNDCYWYIICMLINKMFWIIKLISLDGQQYILLPNATNFISSIISEKAQPMGLVVLESSLVNVFNCWFVIIAVYCQFASTTPFALIKLAIVHLSCLLLHSHAMLIVLTKLTWVTIVCSRLFEHPLTLKSAMLKISFVSSSIAPLKLTKTVFFSFKILSYVCSFVIIFFPITMRLLTAPPTFISKTRRFISVDALISAGTY